MELDTKNDGDIEDMTDNDAVINSLTNIISTLQGSRRMLPTFALNVYGLLFNPLDEITAQEIGENILETIDDWDDRATVKDLLVQPNYDQNRYDIEVTISINNSQETQTTSTILYAL
jgi:phage baseplate assembly protein W